MIELTFDATVRERRHLAGMLRCVAIHPPAADFLQVPGIRVHSCPSVVERFPGSSTRRRDGTLPGINPPEYATTPFPAAS